MDELSGFAEGLGKDTPVRLSVGKAAWDRPSVPVGHQWLPKTLIILDGVPWQASVGDLGGVQIPEWRRWSRVPGVSEKASGVRISPKKAYFRRKRPESGSKS